MNRRIAFVVPFLALVALVLSWDRSSTAWSWRSTSCSWRRPSSLARDTVFSAVTIPVIAVVRQIIETPLLLGLAPVQVVLFALSMFVAALTITPGRSTVMQGGVHLVLFAGFVVLSVSP